MQEVGTVLMKPVNVHRDFISTTKAYYCKGRDVLVDYQMKRKNQYKKLWELAKKVVAVYILASWQVGKAIGKTPVTKE